MESFYARNTKRPEPLEFVKVMGNAWPDDYEDEGALWRHPTAIDCEGPVWLYIQMSELPSDCRGPNRHKWEADLIAVSPFFATDTAMCDALLSTGDYLSDLWDEMDADARIMALCEVLISYGVKMTVITKTGTRARGPFKGCAVEAVVARMLFGFAADRTMNRVGDFGWNFLSGTYGFGGRRDDRQPNEFQVQVIAWLNTHYPEREEFQKERNGE